MNKCPHLLPLEGAPASIFDHLHHSIPFQSTHTFWRTDGYVLAALRPSAYYFFAQLSPSGTYWR